MNYELNFTWQTLSEIMGSDYSSSKKYRVHVNGNDNKDIRLRYTTDSNPNETDLKSIVPAYCDVYFDAGANPSLKSHLSGIKVVIDVTEVE